jgi:hypothetical protein
MFDRWTIPLGLLCALAFAVDARAQCAACGDSGGGDAASGACGGGHGCGQCPPPFIHYAERPPKIKFKHTCPRPVCEPCQMEHYGYYQTCWCAWPFPTDLRHCPCAANHPSAKFLQETGPNDNPTETAPSTPQTPPRTEVQPGSWRPDVPLVLPPPPEPRAQAPARPTPVVRAGWRIANP